MTISRTNRVLPLLTALLLSTSFLRAETVPGLGTANFPTSEPTRRLRRTNLSAACSCCTFSNTTPPPARSSPPKRRTPLSPWPTGAKR